jgi:hypothetical protein
MPVKSKSRLIAKTTQQQKPSQPPQFVKRRKRAAKTVVKNAIPQKVLLYAARLSEPPAISDDVPDKMPFSTEGQ